ncbi:MAG: GGDEF domain-containing protein [Legionellaceae bacterium]|nr:GGDEF domain-containing protein [Legionellaceae bacterium]
MLSPSIVWKARACLVASLGILVILLCWQFMIKPHEIKRLQRESVTTARQLRVTFSSNVEHHLLAVKKIFSQVTHQDYQAYSDVVDDVNLQFKNNHGLEAIVFPPVGSKGSVVLFNPHTTQTGALTSKSQCDKLMEKHPELIKNYQQMKIVSLGGSLCVYDMRSQMLAIFNLKTILDEDLKQEIMKGYFLALSDKITPEIVSPDWTIPLIHREFFQFLGADWDINIYPSKAYVEACVKRAYILFCTTLGGFVSLFLLWFLKFRWKLIPLNSGYVNRLKRLAQYDGLTELPNRRYCLEHLNTIIGRSNRGSDHFSVCFLDCDRFKQINDKYGHHVGDLVLKHLAKSVSQVIRRNDFFARFAGDEFCLILDGTSSDEAIQTALDKILKAVSMPVYLEKKKIMIKVSIGVAVYPESGRSSEHLLKHADEAMYSAKKHKKKKAYVIYQP